MFKKVAIISGLAASLAIGGAVIAKNGLSVAGGQRGAQSNPQGKITKEEARTIALERVKGKVIDEELEKENGRLVYGFDIKQADGKVVEVKVDALTGTLTSAGGGEGDAEDKDNSTEAAETASVSTGENEAEEPDGTNQSEAALMKQATITRAQAERTALKKAKGTVEEGELEVENKTLVYSFDIRNKKGTITEVQVNAKTGKIVSVEEEDASKEAAEKSAEKKDKPRE